MVDSSGGTGLDARHTHDGELLPVSLAAAIVLAALLLEDQDLLRLLVANDLTGHAHAIEKRLAESARNSTPHRAAISQVCKERGITIASHDDATLEHVDEAIENGVRLAEFPTSFDAAKASHEHGMSVLMGAPNIVRGKSHSGNIAARDLAERGVLDVLSSDYVPLSMLYAPFIIADEFIVRNEPMLKQIAVTAGRDINMFRYWFYQPRQ